MMKGPKLGKVAFPALGAATDGSHQTAGKIDRASLADITPIPPIVSSSGRLAAPLLHALRIGGVWHRSFASQPFVAKQSQQCDLRKRRDHVIFREALKRRRFRNNG